MKLLGVTRCMTCCFLCVASTATAQLSSVSVGGTIKASDINAIITALNDAAIPIGNLNLPASTPLTGNITKNGVPFLHNVGTFNTFLGCLAGNLAVSGTANTGVGDLSLIAVTSGSRNTGAGDDTLASLMTGSDNTAVGENALRINVGGSNNTAVGQNALTSNSDDRNTAVGQNALSANVFGFANVAVGHDALRLATGHSNMAIGAIAALNLGAGDDNIMIGTGAGANTSAGSRNIYLGNAGADESDVMRLGGTQQKTFIQGIRGKTTAGAAIAVLIDGGGQLGTVSSSRRYKGNIETMGTAGAGPLALRPVIFRYRQPYADGSTPRQYGLIAEEVAEVYPDLVVYDDTGRPESVQYRKVNAMLLNEVKRLSRDNEVQRSQIEALIQRLSEVERRLETN